MGNREALDWVTVELDYRAGIKTLRQIAGEHGITEGAIRKRAKKEDWERDLAAKIQAKAEALVRKEAVRSEVRSEGAAYEKDVVEENALAIAHVRIAQRKDIQRGRKLAVSLLAELEVETADIELFKELGDILRSEDDKGQDKRNDIYRKVISSAGRIDSMKKLAETMRLLITLEREAFGISNEGDKPTDVTTYNMQF